MLAPALTNRHIPQKECNGRDTYVGKVLESLDGYIRHLAEKKIPRAVVSPERLDLEVDEIVQNTRIKA